MTDFIHNPRRLPRVPVRCVVRIALRSGTFLEARTFNVGPGGCAIETPRRVEPGERAFMEITDARVLGSHVFVGRIAWSAREPPWRSGIAFDAGNHRAASALFCELVSEYPDAAVVAEVVEKIPVDAVLTPTPLPGSFAAVPAEAEVLRALGPGMEARALRDRLGDRWESHLNALFALLERRVVEVARPTLDAKP